MFPLASADLAPLVYTLSIVAIATLIAIVIGAGLAGSSAAWRLAEAGRSGIYDVLVLDEQEQVVATFRGQSRTVGGSMLGGE